jgi:hypothetical protein
MQPLPIARTAVRKTEISAKGGRTAAARPGNGGIDDEEPGLGNALRFHANEQGNLQRMTERRGGGLGECRAERAGRVHRAASLDAHLRLVGAGQVTEFVNDGTLLRRQQQQEET